MNESACSFSSLVKNSHFRKNPSVHNEHMCIADTAVKTKNWKHSHEQYTPVHNWLLP